MNRIKSQTIFLDSSQGSLATDKSHQWTANFEPGLVRCNSHEYISLTLERFMTVADWDWIPENATFTIVDDSGAPPRVIQLPQGNPRLNKIAETVSNSKLQCIYDQSSNRFVFSSLFDFELVFTNVQVASILGFTALRVGPHMTITSTQPIRPLPIDSIAVHVQGVSPMSSAHNVTNIASQLVTTCTTLAVIPVAGVRPYTVLDWQNSGNIFNLVLEDKQLTNLTFSLTNWRNQPLTQLGQHYVILRVDTFRKHSSLETYASDIATAVETIKLLQIAGQLG
jgi:hypothetical protein